MTTTTTPFPLGRIFSTPGAIKAMRDAGESPLRLLKRHVHGDFGDLHEDDVRANELALRQRMRILSAYVCPPSSESGSSPRRTVPPQPS
jgi:hypothetical protein